MQITANTTGVAGGLCVVVDESARDHCVLVIGGSFTTDADGRMTLLTEQAPLSTIDEHYGDPATTLLGHRIPDEGPL